MTRTRARSCEGKKTFETHAEAVREADFWRRRVFGRYHAYRCDHCKKFHVGHRPKPKKRKRW
jgi:hypothetical protein